jgi:predicted enzyme related to lactoylglutathione lyase
VDIQGLFAAAAVSEMERGEEFYTALLGRRPDDRPMDGLIQWRDIVGQAGIQVVLDEQRAGNGNMTIVTPDLSAARVALSGRGLTLGDDVEGDFGILAQIDDPDGNRLTLAEPPRSFD